MRATILAMLLTATQTPVALAETVSFESYYTNQDEQVVDFHSLLALRTELVAVLNKYDSISEVNNDDRIMLQGNALETLRVVDQMRARGKAMFLKVEDIYEQSCLYGVASPLPCSDYRAIYRALMADTMRLGGIYSQVTKDSRSIFSALEE